MKPAFGLGLLWVAAVGMAWTPAVGDKLSAWEVPAAEGAPKSFGPILAGWRSRNKWLVTGSNDQTARLWEVATGKEIRSLMGHTDGVNSVALTGDGKWLVSGGADKTARLWEVSSGNEIRTFQGHRHWVTSVALSSDGKWLVTGSYDKTARLWDVGNSNEVRRFQGHGSWATAVAFSRDGKQLVTASNDETARLWELSSGKEVRRFQCHAKGVACLALSGDGNQLVTGSRAVMDPEGRYDAANDGDIEHLHWVVGMETFPLKQFRDRYYDPGLLAKHLGLHKERPRAVKGAPS
jgi:WD40 repeat protein